MQTVTFPRRLGALFIDWIVAALTAAAPLGTPFAGPDAAEPFVPLVVFFVEVTLLTWLTGTTIGKRIFSLRVSGPDGRSIGLLRAAVRTALVCVVIPPLVQTADHRGLHDLAAGSIVERS